MRAKGQIAWLRTNAPLPKLILALSEISASFSRSAARTSPCSLERGPRRSRIAGVEVMLGTSELALTIAKPITRARSSAIETSHERRHLRLLAVIGARRSSSAWGKESTSGRNRHYILDEAQVELGGISMSAYGTKRTNLMGCLEGSF